MHILFARIGFIKEELQLKNRRETGQLGKTHSKRRVLAKVACSISISWVQETRHFLGNLSGFPMPSKILESDVMRRSYSSTCDVKRENSKNCPYLVLNCEPPLTWIKTAFRHVRHGDLFYENYLEFGRLSQQRSFQLCLIVKIPVFWHKSTTTATEKQERRLPFTFF